MKRQRPITSTWPNALCLALAAISPMSGLAQAGQPMSASEAVKAVRALNAWFECDECNAGELKAVTRYGQSIVPSLIATLNAGLSPASRKMREDPLGARFDELDEQGRKNPKFKMASSKDEFIAQYQDHADARYRIRAAQALVAIGGTNARRALETAVGKAERGDVRTAIQESLNKIR